MKLPVNYANLTRRERKEVREEYIKVQNGACYFCKCDLNKEPPTDVLKMTINKRLFPKNFFKYPVHLHHDHNTNMTIGAVHNRCNAVLWQYHGK